MSQNDSHIPVDYKVRMLRVFQYIDDHLDRPLSLQEIADVACYSPFHFHRIFKFISNEPLNAYISRRRIEKSALSLLHTTTTTLEIAHKFGFNDSASYSRTFKKYYGIPPTEFRKQNPNRFSKIRQLESKNGQPYPDVEAYLRAVLNLKHWMKMNAKIEVKELPKMEVAFVPVMGAQQIGNAYQELMQWGIPKGLINEQTKMITVYHDSFKVTAPDKVRMSACLYLPGPVKIEGAIGRKAIESGKHIVGRFEIAIHEFEKSWTGMFVWMNENGYSKADKDPFGIYYNNPEDHPEKKAIVDLCIPIM